MEYPELYNNENSMQRRDAADVLTNFLSKMFWKPKEIVLDVGCGPGDVTYEILYPILQDKIEKLVAVDKSSIMINYAKSTYNRDEIKFKIMDIEDSIDCSSYSQYYDKIFSFYCFHWVYNKEKAMENFYTMLKPGGEVLILFLLINPMVHLYKALDVEWQKYAKDIKPMSISFLSKEEIEALVINAGFRVIKIETNIKTYTFPNFASLLSAIRAVDNMYNVLPTHLHEKYSQHVKSKICDERMVNICSNTGKTTKTYLPITIHAVKD